MIIPKMYGKIKNVPNHQPVMYCTYLYILLLRTTEQEKKRILKLGILTVKKERKKKSALGALTRTFLRKHRAQFIRVLIISIYITGRKISLG